MSDFVKASCKKCGKNYEVDKDRWWRTTRLGNADTAKCPRCHETLDAGFLDAVTPKESEE